MSRPAPIRDAILKYISDAGSEGRRFSEIQRHYAVDILKMKHFDPIRDRGYGCFWLCDSGKGYCGALYRPGLLSRYCIKSNGRWVMKNVLVKRGETK